MTARRVSFPTHRQLLSLVLVALVLLPLNAMASTPIINGQPTEIVSGRMFLSVDATGQRVSMPDLALSGRLLVQMGQPGASPQLETALQATGAAVLKRYKTPGMFLVSVPAGTTVAAARQQWRMQPGVSTVGFDRLCHFTVTPNDPQYSQQWHWPLIAAPQAWDTQTGSASVIIAILDSGVYTDHPDLSSRIWTNPGETPGNGIDDDANGYIDDYRGWDTQFDENDPNPDPSIDWGAMTHGTHVAGCAAAASNNGIGVAGADWNAKIMAVKIGNGDDGLLTSDTIEGIEYATANGADVINMSLGGGYSEIWDGPIGEAYAAGVSVVAAAGNESWTFTDSPDSWMSPVCNDGPNFLDNRVIGVGATDRFDYATYFTNLDNSSREYVDVMAPGYDIFSTVVFAGTPFTAGYANMSGTSMASPVTAGLVGLLKAQYPQFDASAIIYQLRAACESIDAKNPQQAGMMGNGRINSVRGMIDVPPGAPRTVMAFDTPADSGGSITLAWSLSPDDGRGFNDVTHYTVERGTVPEGPFDTLATVDKGTKAYTDLEVVDYTDYYYVVRAFDRSGSTASRVTEAAHSRDDLAPPQVTVTGGDTQGDLGGSISISWSSYVAPSDFGAYHVYRAESNTDTATEMTLIATITSSATKSYQDRTTQDDVDYYYAVTCVDNALEPNEILEVVCLGPVRSNPNYTFAFSPGLSLVGIGLELQDDDLGTIFGTADAQFARWDPSSGAYETYVAGASSSLLQQSPGRGFWLRSTRPIMLNLSGNAPSGDVRVDFEPGWNQLANPYIDEVDVRDDAQVRIGGTSYTLEQSNEQDFTRDYFWGYDSVTSSYKLISASLPFSRQTIKRGDGFFFMSNRVGQLVLHNPADLSTEQVRPKARPKPSRSNWAMRLSASIEGAADTDNFLGVSPKAESISRIAAPPPLVAGFDFSFTGNGIRSATEFVESLGAGHAWQGEVTCTRPQAQIKLSWPDLSQLPRDCKPILRDAVSGQSVYMRTASGYSFTLQPGETARAFVIDISPKVGDLLAIRSLQTSAAADGAEISYSLSAAAEVDVQIVNIAGRLVRQISGASGDKGPNVALWNGCNNAGLRAPGGSYLVKISARSDSGQVVSAVQPLAWR